MLPVNVHQYSGQFLYLLYTHGLAVKTAYAAGRHNPSGKDHLSVLSYRELHTAQLCKRLRSIDSKGQLH